MAADCRALGDVLIGETDAVSRQGQAHLFYGGAVPYTPTSTNHKVIAGTHAGAGYFGNALSLVQLGEDVFDDAVVGAPAVFSGTGRAYVFAGTEAGLATAPTFTVEGPDGASGSFGLILAR